MWEKHKPPSQQHLSTTSGEVFVIQLNKVASTGSTPELRAWVGVMEGLWQHFVHLQYMDLHRAAYELSIEVTVSGPINKYLCIKDTVLRATSQKQK